MPTLVAPEEVVLVGSKAEVELAMADSEESGVGSSPADVTMDVLIMTVLMGATMIMLLVEIGGGSGSGVWVELGGDGGKKQLILIVVWTYFIFLDAPGRSSPSQPLLSPVFCPLD